MTPEASLAIVAACYAGGLALGVVLPPERRHPPVAALGIGLVSLGPSGFGIVGFAEPLVAALVAALVVCAVQERRVVILEPVGHVVLLGAAQLLLVLLGPATPTPSASLIVRATIAACLVPLGQAALRTAHRWHRQGSIHTHDLLEDAQSTLVFDVVSVCLAGLSVMAIQAIGPPGAALALAPIAAARIGFARYRRAKLTYEELVRALGLLAETSGYAQPGHHERTADLVARAAAHLGSWGNARHQLELVALLHDVGAVSYPEPVDLAGRSRDEILSRSAIVLEETGYLASSAHLLRSEGSETREGRLVRLACELDRLPGGVQDRLVYLRRRGLPRDEEVLDALEAAVSATSAPLPDAEINTHRPADGKLMQTDEVRSMILTREREERERGNPL